jgi:hypothetical protein
MRFQSAVFGTGLICAVVLSGCKKTDDSKLNFTNAINAYYASRPACLWAQPLKFPVQVNASDTDKTQGFDALVDQGLLTRSTGEKKVFILGSHQVTNYDVSDKGRGVWTADTQQPGYGNFCYGTLKVAGIDSYTPTSSQPGATATVNYRASLSGAPSWAQAAEVQVAFPQVKANLSQPLATSATLTDTTGGWAVSGNPAGPVGSSHAPATAADGSIVQ